MAVGTLGISPASASVQEVIADPSFEEGAPNSHWTELPGSTYPLIVSGTYPVAPRTGDWKVWLCGYVDCIDQVWQTVSIPAGATGGTLSFYRRVATGETSSICYDKLVVKAGGTQVGSNICNTHPTADYAETTIDISDAVVANAGSSLEIRFVGTANYSLDTSFYIDDVSLEVTVPDPTTHARTASLSLRFHLKAKGTLASELEGCIEGRALNIQKRRKDGTWKTIETATSRTDGTYSKRIPDRPGRYRVVAPKEVIGPYDTCAKATSPVRKHTH